MDAANTTKPYEHYAHGEMLRLAQRAGRIEAQRDHLIDTLKAMERALERGWIELARERGQVALQQIKEIIDGVLEESKP